MAPHSKQSADLVMEMAPYWDPQFLPPVLEWLNSRSLYPKDEINALRLRLLEKTAIIDQLKSAYEANGRTPPTDLELRKTQLVGEITKTENALIPFTKALTAYKRDQQNRMSGLPEKKYILELSEWWVKQKPTNLSGMDESERQLLMKEYLPFGANVDEEIPRLAKLLFRCAEYSQAVRHLSFYLDTVSELIHEGSDPGKRQGCLWGIIAAVIMGKIVDLRFEDMTEKPVESIGGEEENRETPVTNEVDAAAGSLLRLAEVIESVGVKSGTNTEMLMRAWLLHWSIWLLFRYYFYSQLVCGVVPRVQSWSEVPEWFLDEQNMMVAHLVAPHLLRYYAVYAILNPKRKDHFQSVIQAIHNGRSKYSDPITSLLEALFIDFDFDAAQLHMSDVVKTCQNDFFLDPLKGMVEENARLVIFETYCRIHRSINIDMMAMTVNMSSNEAERWIVNLIRNARLEAKIDSEKNRVEMSSVQSNVYQMVIDTTRTLTMRSNIVLQGINKPFGNRDDAKDGNRQRVRNWNKEGGGDFSPRGGRRDGGRSFQNQNRGDFNRGADSEPFRR